MPGCNPERILVKLPVPVPSVVLLLLIVGFDAVAQQTPLAVIDPPPSSVILPPDTALIEVIDETVVVVRIACTTCAEVKDTSLP